MADVFISYKSEDRGVVEDIVRGLRAENLDVWWDQGIAPTAEWRAEIAQNLQAAKAVIVVWSRTTADLEAGKWVIQEAEDADRRGALVPIMIDDTLPPLGMRHRQAADLVDWRGDRSDPRWRGFVETVRAKLEGRTVDAGLARDAGEQTAGAMLKGRGGQLVLALGLAALVVTSAIAFGPMVAAALVGGVALGYLVLNLLFSRRRGDRAAQTFLRRAFAVGWVTTLANVVVWGGAIGAGAWPYAKGLLYDTVEIAVYDELRRPVPGAQVTVRFDGRETPAPLSAEGVGGFSYPLYWGPTDAVVVLRHRDFALERPLSRPARGRFEDLALGAPSGEERLRVTHVTVKELAIDLMLQGRTPPEVAGRFPNLVGVVRNAVWEEADRYVRLYAPFSAEAVRVSAREDGAPEGPEPVDPDATYMFDDIPASYGALRWPRPVSAIVPMDFSAGIVGCPADQALDDQYRLFIGDMAWYGFQDRLRADEAALRALGLPQLAALLDEEGALPATLTRAVDHAWLAQHMPRPLSPPRAAGDDEAWVNFDLEALEPVLAYFIAHRAPAGVVNAQFRLRDFSEGSCDATPVSVHLGAPDVSLRVSIIENISQEALPISAFVQGMATRDAIALWRAGEGVTETQETPWSMGVLQPGEAVAVPRRLVINPLPVYRTEASAQAGGGVVSFDVLPAFIQVAEEAADPLAPPEPLTPELEGFAEQQRMMDARSAGRFRIAAGQVAFSNAGYDAAEEPPAADAPRYVVGPSVERLAVTINGVEFALREDRGITLAMVGGYESGSCPFVFATAPGGAAAVNRGQVLTDFIGPAAEGVDRIVLGRAVDRIEIREIEPEVTHLNRVRLVVHDEHGAARSYAPADRALAAVDDARLTLRQGEALALRFPGYAPRPGDASVALEVWGYYTPQMASAREQFAYAWLMGAP